MATFTGDSYGFKLELLAEVILQVTEPKQVCFFDIITSDPAPWDRVLVEGTYLEAIDYAVLLNERRHSGLPPTCNVTIVKRGIHRLTKV